MTRVFSIVLLILAIATTGVGWVPTLAESADPVLVAQGPPQSQRSPEDPAAIEMEKQRKRLANKQRDQELKRDTDKLLQLATELKLYVDKSNENVLSLDVIKKADEIERLAKSVKHKMQGTY